MTPKQQYDLEERLLALAQATNRGSWPLDEGWLPCSYTEDLVRFYAVVVQRGVGEINRKRNETGASKDDLQMVP
jgi:hypothetical protein